MFMLVGSLIHRLEVHWIGVCGYKMNWLLILCFSYCYRHITTERDSQTRTSPRISVKGEELNLLRLKTAKFSILLNRVSAPCIWVLVCVTGTWIWRTRALWMDSARLCHLGAWACIWFCWKKVKLLKGTLCRGKFSVFLNLCEVRKSVKLMRNMNRRWVTLTKTVRSGYAFLTWQYFSIVSTWAQIWPVNLNIEILCWCEFINVYVSNHIHSTTMVASVVISSLSFLLVLCTQKNSQTSQ